MPQTTEKLHRLPRPVGLREDTMLELSSAADALAGGDQRIGAGSLDAEEIGAGQQIPFICGMTPQSGAAIAVRRNGLAETQCLSVAVCGDGRKRAVELLLSMKPEDRPRVPVMLALIV